VIVSALDLLEARAQFDAPERAVSMRIAEHAGCIYLDLADEHWRAVEIGPDGGECSNGRQCGSVDLPGCYPSQYLSAADR